MQGSSSKSASAVGVDAGHSRSRRRSVTDVGLPLAGTHRPGSLHRFSENLRRIRGCPRGRQSRRPLQRPLLSPVGADDSVRPQTAPVFTGISGESVAAQRADVGIGPLHDSGKFVLPRKFRMQGGKDGAAGGAAETASTERASALCAKSLILCVRFLLSKPQTLCWFAAWVWLRRIHKTAPFRSNGAVHAHMGGGSYSAEMR